VLSVAARKPANPSPLEGRAHLDCMLVTIGVDTHSDVHVAAALDQTGRLLGIASFPTSTRGYTQLATWAES